MGGAEQGNWGIIEAACDHLPLRRALATSYELVATLIYHHASISHARLALGPRNGGAEQRRRLRSLVASGRFLNGWDLPSNRG